MSPAGRGLPADAHADHHVGVDPLFSLQSGDLLPVPLNGSVVDVPLFLAHDQGAAATASLADAAGMT